MAPPPPNTGTLAVIVSLIRDAATRAGVPPCDVTPAQFWTVATGRVDEWSVRKLGGFTGIRAIEFPPPANRPRNAVLPQVTPSPARRLPQLGNFTVHTTELRELFDLAKLPATGVLRVVVQPDTHVPEHDERAVAAFLAFVRDYKPHGYVNLGDFMEMGAVSHWRPRDDAPKRLGPEVEAANALLDQLDRALGPGCVYKRFLIGNHEDWLDQYRVERMSELEGLGLLRVQDLLGLKDRGFRVVPLNEILRLGQLHFIHGYYTNKYHAFKHLEVFGCNLMYGHLHDIQSYIGASVGGVYEALSIGCLRTLNAPFMKGRPNNWAHAFGIVEYRIDGTYTRYVPIIVDGRFSFAGWLYDGNVGAGGGHHGGSGRGTRTTRKAAA